MEDRIDVLRKQFQEKTIRFRNREWIQKQSITYLEQEIKSTIAFIEKHSNVPCLKMEQDELRDTVDNMKAISYKKIMTNWVVDTCHGKKDIGHFQDQNGCGTPDGKCTLCADALYKMQVSGFDMVHFNKMYFTPEDAWCSQCSTKLCAGKTCTKPECLHVIIVHANMFKNPHTWKRNGCGFICGRHVSDIAQVCKTVSIPLEYTGFFT